MKNSVLKICIICFFINSSIFSYSFNININIDKLNIKNNGEYTKLSIAKYKKIIKPGYPELPKKIFYIAIPPNSEILSIDIFQDTNEITIEKPVVPSAKYTISSTKLKRIKAGIYKENRYFPKAHFKYSNKKILKGINFIRCVFYPVLYNSVQNKLNISSEININLKTIRKIAYRPKKKKIKRIKRRLKYYSKNIINIEKAKNWYLSSVYGNSSNNITYSTNSNYSSNSEVIVNKLDIDKLIAKYKKGSATITEVSSNVNKYFDSFGDYLIITTDNIKSSGILNSFISFKENKGFSVIVSAVETDIYPYYSGDNAQKIKKYVFEMEDANNISNLFIIGSIDQVPSRLCPTFSNEQAWSDYYYADVDSNWNSSGNSKYGEYGIDKNINFSAEVNVGRLPFDNIAEIGEFLQRSMNFENLAGGAKSNALLVGALSDPDTDGAYLMESMKTGFLNNSSINSVSMYENEGNYASSYNGDITLNSSNINIQMQQPKGIVCWWAHGYSNGSGIVRWIDSSNTPVLLTRSDISGFSQNNSSVVFCCSCYNDNGTQSIAKELLKKSAVSVIATSSTAWYKVGWENKDDGGSTTIVYYFYKKLVEEKLTAGQALSQTKYEEFEIADDKYMQHNIVGLNLLGDPGLTY